MLVISFSANYNAKLTKLLFVLFKTLFAVMNLFTFKLKSRGFLFIIRF